MLEGVPLFEGLAVPEREALERSARVLRFARGDLVLRQGARADALFAVRSGKVKCSLQRRSGREATVALLGPGDTFGELALLRDGQRSAQVTALEPTVLVRLGKAPFLRALAASPALGVALCGLLAERLRALAEHYEEVTAMPLEQRLARKLVLLSERWGPSLALSQQELAELADTSRQSVNRCLARWRAQGLVSRRGRALIVEKSAALRALAGES